MDFITEHVALGSMQDALDGGNLSAHGIEAVLSMEPVTLPGFVTHRAYLPIPDGEPLPEALVRTGVDFIDSHVKSGRHVFVHCRMGISRAPSIAIWYLCQCHGMSVDEALEHVCRVRPEAEPHELLLASIRARFNSFLSEMGRARGLMGRAPKRVLGNPAATSGQAERVELSSNENPFGPSPRVALAIRNALEGLSRYPDKDADALRQAIAERNQLDVSQVVVGNGASELLDLIARATLSPGDQAIVGQPVFMPYHGVIRRSFGEPVVVPLRDFHYDLEAMATAVTKQTRLIILGNPNNPTGTVIREREMKDFLEQVPDRVLVVVDEAYSDYVCSDDYPDMLRLMAEGRNVVILKSFSKVYGLAGLRLGYAMAHCTVTARINGFRQHYNTNALAQEAALAALADEEHVESCIARNAEGRVFLSRALTRRGIHHVPSETNFLLVRVGSGERVRQALAEAGILVKGMERFGLPEYIRVSVGKPEQNQAFITALASILGASSQVGGSGERETEGLQTWR